MKKINILGVGNALVDIQFSIQDNFLEKLGFKKGTMDLKNLEEQKDTYNKLIKAYGGSENACGGSATNTIYAASILGSNCSFIGKVADDSNGNFYIDNLNKAGIKNDCMSESKGVSGNCLIMVSPDAERTMSTFLGISSELQKIDIEEELISESEIVYLEGYLASSYSCNEASKEIIRLAKENKTKVAVSLSDPNIVEAFKDRLEEWMENKIDYLFCNEEEAKAFSGSSDLEIAKKELSNLAETCFITRGNKGVLVISNSVDIKIDGYEANAIDSNGAGDMFAGATLYKISCGEGNKNAARFGCFLASKGVENFGPRLLDEDYRKYQQLFNEI